MLETSVSDWPHCIVCLNIWWLLGVSCISERLGTKL